MYIYMYIYINKNVKKLRLVHLHAYQGPHYCRTALDRTPPPRKNMCIYICIYIYVYTYIYIYMAVSRLLWFADTAPHTTFFGSIC